MSESFRTTPPGLVEFKQPRQRLSERREGFALERGCRRGRKDRAGRSPRRVAFSRRIRNLPPLTGRAETTVAVAGSPDRAATHHRNPPKLQYLELSHSGRLWTFGNVGLGFGCGRRRGRRRF